MREIATGAITRDGRFDDDIYNYQFEVRTTGGEEVQAQVQTISINGSSITLEAPELDVSGFHFDIFEAGMTTDLELKTNT